MTNLTIRVKKMSKRKRDESAQYIKHEDIVLLVLNVVSTWTDSCGAKFEIEHQIKKEQNKIVLKIGFFDELGCDQLQQLKDVVFPGDFVIRCFECNLEKQMINLTITREKLAEAPPSEIAAEPQNADVMRLRVVYTMPEVDAREVQKCLDVISKTTAIKLAKIVDRPDAFIVYVTVKDCIVSDAVIAKCLQMRGNINFEEKLLSFEVEKSVKDIVD